MDHLKKPFLLILFFCNNVFCQENPLAEIMKLNLPIIKKVRTNLKAHQVQLKYIQINRDSDESFFKEYYFQKNDSNYFYPASTVKLPIAILALQKINQLKKDGINIDMNTPFHIIDPISRKYIAKSDSTNPKNQLTISHLIKKVFLISDNDAYNYLFDFLGKDYINSEMKKKGINNFSIRHKFLGLNNNQTWEYCFFNKKDTLYMQKSIESKNIPIVKLKNQDKGIANLVKGKLVNKPMNFSKKNWLSLSSQTKIIKRIFFPETFPRENLFSLDNYQIMFIKKWMGKNTLESTIFSSNEQNKLYDSYVKFFIYGDTKGKMNDEIRIYNKVGFAYGTVSDVAYIVNKKKGIEFILAGTILVNSNQIFNDDIYENEEVGIPFLAEIGRQIYLYELNRR